MTNFLEKYFEKKLGRYQDILNQELVENVELSIIEQCVDDDDFVDTYEFWEQAQWDHDPLFVDWASPFHGHGYAWEAARDSVEGLSDETLKAYYNEYLKYTYSFLEDIPYLQEYKPQSSEYIKAYVEASLVFSYIEGILQPDTPHNLEDLILHRYQKEIA